MKLACTLPDGRTRIRVFPDGKALAKEKAKRLADLNEESGSADAVEITATPTLYRDAWKVEGGAVTVDMDKAKTIHMATVRSDRDKKLSLLDAEELAAISKGDDLTKIHAEKQRLRDIPDMLDLSPAKTPEDLKHIWPLGLHQAVGVKHG